MAEQQDVETLRFLEGIRVNIATQLERVTREGELRAQLLQEELDRRFSSLRDLVDERRSNNAHDVQLLQEEIDRRLANMDELNLQRFDDLKELMVAGQHAARDAVQAALMSAEKAVGKAELASEKRFESVNEFRKALTDQTSTFLPRAEFDGSRASLSDRIDANVNRVGALELRLTSRLDRGEGTEAGAAAVTGSPFEAAGARAAATRALITTVISVVAVLASVISVIVIIARK